MTQIQGPNDSNVTSRTASFEAEGKGKIGIGTKGADAGEREKKPNRDRGPQSPLQVKAQGGRTAARNFRPNKSLSISYTPRLASSRS